MAAAGGKDRQDHIGLVDHVCPGVDFPQPGAARQGVRMFASALQAGEDIMAVLAQNPAHRVAHIPRHHDRNGPVGHLLSFSCRVMMQGSGIRSK